MPYSPILGCLEQLDDTRVVFIGEREDRPDVFFLGFRNHDGKDTKLVISAEAMAAMSWLMDMLPTKANADRVRFPPPPSSERMLMMEQQQRHWVAKLIDETNRQG